MPLPTSPSNYSPALTIDLAIPLAPGALAFEVAHIRGRASHPDATIPTPNPPLRAARWRARQPSCRPPFRATRGLFYYTLRMV